MCIKIFSSVVAVVLCMSVFVISVSATTYDLKDFLKSTDTVGTAVTNNFMIQSRSESYYHVLYGGHSLFSWTGSLIAWYDDDYPIDGSGYFSILYYPFGRDNYISCDLLRTGSLTFDNTYQTQGLSYKVNSDSLTFDFYDSNFTQIRAFSVNHKITSFSVPDNAVYCKMYLSVDFVHTLDGVYHTFTPTLYFHNVYDPVTDIGDLISGDPGEPVLPDSGDMQGVSDMEDNLLSGSSSVISDIKSFGDSALSFVSGLASGFGFAQFLVADVSAKLPFVPSLLYVSLAIGIFASIVGIVGMIFRKGGD